MNKKLPGWLVLCVIALCAGAVLTAAFQLTKPHISEQVSIEADNARKNVLPAAQSFNQLELADDAAVDDCYAGLVGKDIVGYTAKITVKGYGGPIEIIVGVDMQGTLTGVWAGGEKFSETPGLGSKTKDASFTAQFVNKAAPLELGKDVDAITGATISSSAVLSGVNKAAEYIIDVVLELNAGSEGPEDLVFGGVLPGATTKQEETAPEGIDAIWSSDAGCVVFATAEGYHGPVQVQLGVAHNGSIAGIRITEEGFAETAGLGEQVKEKPFLKQFIGLSGELALHKDVDGVSNATISSKAVVKAVNAALAAAQPFLDPSKAPAAGADESGPLPGATNLQEQPAPEGVDALWAAEEGYVVQVTVKGYESPIQVKVGISKDGVVMGMEVGGSEFAETPGLGEQVKEKAFWSQFVGQSGPFELKQNVDGVTGATVSSKAVVKAVNTALEAIKEQ